MRKIVTVSVLSVLAASVAIGGYVNTRPAGNDMTADLERDLQLATSVQAPRTAVVSAIEQGRNGAPSGNAKGQRMVVPTKKRAPSAEPSPTVTEVPSVPVVAEEPAVTTAATVTEPVAVAASEPVPTVTVPAPEPTATIPVATGGPSDGAGTEGVRGNGDGGGGIGRRGTMIGGMVGVILRGGGAGHDNCEPPNRRNGGGIRGGAGIMGGIASGAPNGSIPGGAMPRGRGW